MPTLKFYEIPYFLRDSTQYKEYEKEFDEYDEINIPTEYFLTNDRVENLQDFKKLLSTVDYWDFNEYPFTLITYTKYNTKEILIYLYENLETLYILEFTKYILPLLEIRNISISEIIWDILVKDQSIKLPEKWCDYCMKNKEEVLKHNFLNDEYTKILKRTINYEIKYWLNYYGDVFGERNVVLDFYFYPLIFDFRILFGEKDMTEIDNVSFFNKQNFVNLYESIIKNEPYTLEEIFYNYDNSLNKKISYNEKFKILCFIKHSRLGKRKYEIKLTIFNKMKIVNYLKEITEILDKQPILRTDFPTSESINISKEQLLRRSNLLMPEYVIENP
jgi:hypothetical protein